jgi:hypothetical protein
VHHLSEVLIHQVFFISSSEIVFSLARQCNLYTYSLEERRILKSISISDTPGRFIRLQQVKNTDVVRDGGYFFVQDLSKLYLLSLDDYSLIEIWTFPQKTGLIEIVCQNPKAVFLS